MAQPTTEVVRFRTRINGLVEELRELDAILAIVEDHGANDTERQAFFTAVFAPEYDITWQEFAAGVVAVRALVTARNTHRLALATLLI